MEILIKVLQFLLSLSLLIVLHEMGHFFFARLFKTRVEKFYLFFNPWFSLFKVKKGETEYGVGWIPLGGYVKISGMIDESMDMEQMKQPAQPHEFRSKPAWQRLLIMLGGVLVNFVLALVIYAGVLYAWGDKYLPNENATYGIAVDSLAYNAGLRSGDKIISIDNRKVEDFHQIKQIIALEDGKVLQIQRDSQIINLQLPENTIHSIIRDKEFITVRFPFVIEEFANNSAAQAAGLQKGDKMLKINGEDARFYDQVRILLTKHKNDSITVTIDRAGTTMDFRLKVPESGLFGVAVKNWVEFFELKQLNYGFFESIPAGISKGFSTLTDYIKQFKLVFSSKAKGYESLGGFISIGNIFPGSWNWPAFWELTAFLSIVLAFMNVLPIPALDGGHVLFLLYEMITGRKPSDKFLEYAQITGIVLLLGLLLYANLNDVIKLFAR